MEHRLFIGVHRQKDDTFDTVGGKKKGKEDKVYWWLGKERGRGRRGGGGTKRMKEGGRGESEDGCGNLIRTLKRVEALGDVSADVIDEREKVPPTCKGNLDIDFAPFFRK
ncbi:hypothetical protein Btru_045589 [Bulinus truncatus]|nr:hypothetical protein Btru_045589 [Bulinus truncatus]